MLKIGVSGIMIEVSKGLRLLSQHYLMNGSLLGPLVLLVIYPG